MTLDEIVRHGIFMIDDMGVITMNTNVLNVRNPVNDKAAIRLHLVEIDPGVAEPTTDLYGSGDEPSTFITASAIRAPAVSSLQRDL
jgi:hypothetical protein